MADAPTTKVPPNIVKSGTSERKRELKERGGIMWGGAAAIVVALAAYLLWLAWNSSSSEDSSASSSIPKSIVAIPIEMPIRKTLIAPAGKFGDEFQLDLDYCLRWEEKDFDVRATHNGKPGEPRHRSKWGVNDKAQTIALKSNTGNDLSILTIQYPRGYIMEGENICPRPVEVKKK